MPQFDGLVCNCFARAQRQVPVVRRGNLQPTDDCIIVKHGLCCARARDQKLALGELVFFRTNHMRRSSDHTTAITLLQHFGSSQSRFITFVEEVFSEVPRYHFHVKSGQLTVLDQEGVELADIANAVTEAAQRAQEIVLKDVLQGVSAVSRMIVIADDELHTVTELPF
jgi:hypothetical protein